MRSFPITPTLTLGALTLLAMFGCSSSDNKNVTTSNAGASSVTTTGGSTSTSTATGTGGVANGGATNGTSATGGATTAGGAATTGGATTAGGVAATGGKTTTGTVAATGGTTTTSTVAATGGTTTTSTVAATGGATSTGNATLDDLIGAICDWEFKCCDSGEAKWELGPIVTSAALCKEKFVYLLRNDNAAQSPYPASGSPAANGLLISLAYQLDMSRVTENPTGIAQCVASWKAQKCNAALDPKAATAHCGATSYGVVDPCNLTNLVKPKLAAGDICNFALTETAYNDVECPAGTTCLAATNADNPNKNYPTCVTRGIANAPCTLDKDCDFNFYCNTSGHCIEKGSPGAACSYKTPTAPAVGVLDVPCKPGLSCNPISKVCVQDCTNNSVCTAAAASPGSDLACPTGSSCIPVTVENDSTSFKVCAPIGVTAGAKCNSLEDCGGDLYCAGTSCAPRQGANQACSPTVAGNCVTGMYCRAGTNVCTSYTGNGLACTQAASGITAAECDPATAIGCVYKWNTTTVAADFICSNALLANEQRCGNDFDCQSSRCEFASALATYKTCIAGAAVGANCDATLTTGQYLRCGVGLACNAGLCVQQVGPGGKCESTSTAGAADASLCQNSTCNSTVWTTVSPSNIMCTDLAVPVVNGGTGVTCDGK